MKRGFQKGNKINLGRKRLDLMGKNSPSKRPEVREKIRKKMRGNQNTKGKHWKLLPFSEGHKRKLKENHKGMLGKYHTNKTIEKLREIKIGERNPQWQGGISFEPYTTDWTETLRRAIRERDHYTCQLCSKYGNVVHHIDYNKKNCNPKNLITLCRGCNSKVNKNRNYWIKRFNTIDKIF